MSRDVFISYSNQDKATAGRACEALEAAGISCWIAPRDIRPGIPYGDSITEGIRGAGAVLLVLSAAADDSPHVLRETECAVNARIPILPFQVDEVPPRGHLAYFLDAVHRIDAREGSLEQHLSGLVKATGRLLLEGTAVPAANRWGSAPGPLGGPTDGQDGPRSGPRRPRFNVTMSCGVTVMTLLLISMLSIFYYWKIQGNVPVATADGWSAEEWARFTAKGGNEILTGLAWAAFNAGEYKKAVRYAELCVYLFGRQADQTQRDLAAQWAGIPTGELNQLPLDQIRKNGLLNDVATCLFISGRSSEELGQVVQAKRAYRRATGLTYARCWDEGGWFWSPAEAAAYALDRIEKPG